LRHGVNSDLETVQVSNTTGETFGLRHPHPAGRAMPQSHRFIVRLAPKVSVLLSVVLFLVCAGLIYLACEYFVNGVEWVGRRMNLGETTTGTVLAAFGTALPESAVTFVAVVFGKDADQKNIGVGAAVGGPLVLATISYAVVGFVLLLSQRRLKRADASLEVDCARLCRDQGWFVLIFVATIALGLVDFPLKRWLGIVLFGAYALYVWREMRNDGQARAEHDELEPLKFRPHDANPSMAWAVVQTVGALIVISIASRIFVSQLETIGSGLGISAQFVALLLSPVATELPETLNAVIWVRQGRERLALANLSGAMMIQATVPAGLGMLFTEWRFDGPLIAAGIVTATAVVALWLVFQRRAVSARSLVPVGGLYVVFAAVVLWMQSR
jgi:cation:H+ antiporter